MFNVSSIEDRAELSYLQCVVFEDRVELNYLYCVVY